MRNKLEDLNNQMYELLELINDDDLTEEEKKKLETKVRLSTTVADRILDIANIELSTFKTCMEYGNEKLMDYAPPMITGNDKKHTTN